MAWAMAPRGKRRRKTTDTLEVAGQRNPGGGTAKTDQKALAVLVLVKVTVTVTVVAKENNRRR